MPVPLLILSLLLAGCLSTHYNLATQQQEYTVTSADKEVAMGRKLARRVEQELELVQDEALQERVRLIGQRLAAVCDRKELLYTFRAVADKDVNAFSLPGGYVYVNDGLIKNTRSDDELAAVLAHEIAHIAARHAVKRFETSLGAQLLQLATIAAARQGASVRGAGVVFQAARLAYARQDELEADRLAVRYLNAAGFDPKATISFLERLQSLHHEEKPRYLPRGVTRPEYALTHPFVPERIRAVKEALYGVADYVDYLNTSP